MDKLKFFLLKYPTHAKYLLLALDIFFALVAIRIFINYTNIESAILETTEQANQKDLQLAYTKQFELPYEKSDYAKYFLKHENNILLPGETILSFKVKDPDAEMIGSGAQKSGARATAFKRDAMPTTAAHAVSSPQESWALYIKQMLQK